MINSFESFHAISIVESTVKTAPFFDSRYNSHS